MKYLGLIWLFYLALQQATGQNTIPKVGELPSNVGDIAYNSKTDRPDFYLCDQGHIYWYYNVKANYEGGKPAIRQILLSHYQYNPAYSALTGWITISFVINCKGETDRFRTAQLDANYQKTSFPDSFVRQFEQGVRALTDWVPGTLHGGAPANSYYYLTFKINQGRFTDFTP